MSVQLFKQRPGALSASACNHKSAFAHFGRFGSDIPYCSEAKNDACRRGKFEFHRFFLLK
jgi:hypothetical protein